MVRLLVVALAAAVVAVGVLVAFAATRPPVFEVRRTALIKAPPEKIFALIDDLRGWRAWSPYENLDPGMARDYSGPESGPGAAYAWRSDGRAGVGRMAIVEAEAPTFRPPSRKTTSSPRSATTACSTAVASARRFIRACAISSGAPTGRRDRRKDGAASGRRAAEIDSRI